MPDYQNAKVYKLVSKHLPDTCYVGSTAQKYLSSRKSGHKQDYKLFLKNEHHYVSSFEVMQFSDAEIILIEECPCESEKQLLAIERKYIESVTCVNKNIPGRTMHEWYVENKEKVLESSKKWASENPEKVKAAKKKYADNPTNIETRRAKKKALYAATGAAESREYYQKNKERIAKRNREKKILCESKTTEK
jgi:hypothetical protein